MRPKQPQTRRSPCYSEPVCLKIASKRKKKKKGVGWEGPDIFTFIVSLELFVFTLFRFKYSYKD